MKCVKCKKEVSSTDTFCPYCGTKVEKVEKETKTTTKKVAKAEVVKAEPVKTEPVKTAPVGNQSGKGLAIASMALGIAGIVLTFVFGPFAFILSILGLIFSIIAKCKNAFKTAGLITSIVGIVLQVIATIIIVFFFSAFTAFVGEYIDEDIIDDYKSTYKYATPYGEWKCTPYPKSDYKSNQETTLKLKYDNTFVYGPSDDLTNNYYSGTFTYEKEYEKNKDYTDREFIDVKAPVTSFKMNGVDQTVGSNMNLNMEMEFINDYDEAVIIFYNTYNTYKCEK